MRVVLGVVFRAGKMAALRGSGVKDVLLSYYELQSVSNKLFVEYCTTGTIPRRPSKKSSTADKRRRLTILGRLKSKPCE